MQNKTNRKTGFEKEDKVAAYLMQKGFRIVERNFYTRGGEIDIIGYDGEYLVFVEVKYRSGNSLANPLSAVGFEKQRKICRTADYYRYRKGIGQDVPVRYDVVGMWEEKIEWIKNAFPHIYTKR